MALTDRIAALVTAIATAFNSRIQNPVTGYDVYVLNGGTLTQAQWLASLVGPTGPAGQAGTAPALNPPIATEQFTGLADGAAWPTQWTKRDGATAAPAATVVGQAGRINTPAGASLGTRQQLESMGTLFEYGATAIVTADSNAAVALFICASGTGTGSLAGAGPGPGFLVVLDPGASSLTLYQSTAAGALTQIGGNQINGAKYKTGVPIRLRIERVGHSGTATPHIRARSTVVGVPEATDWELFGQATQNYSGFAGVGVRSTSGATASQFATIDDFFTYALPAGQAYTTPGTARLATQAEITAGTESWAVTTPAMLANANLRPPLTGGSDPTVNTVSQVGRLYVNTSTLVTFICVANNTGAAVFRRLFADVQVFTNDGTWIQPAWAQFTRFWLIGGGGGGGGGGRQATSTTSGGGGGGAGGAILTGDFATQSVASQLSVSIGQGGAAGAATTADSTSGGNGGSGGSTSFTPFGQTVSAAGGGPGLGGSTAGGSGGSFASGTISSTGGGSGQTSAGSASSQQNSSIGATGGGGGGGLAAGGSATNGGVGQSNMLHAASVSGKTTVAAGSGTSASGNTPAGATGGGGGASSVTNVNQTGGNGGAPGGGAGGGGAGINGQSSGAGGTGGRGLAVFISI